LKGWAGFAVYPWDVYAPVANRPSATIGGIILLLLAVMFAVSALAAQVFMRRHIDHADFLPISFQFFQFTILERYCC
jgi:hypothetical protein